jgi:beta-phosphoglucomutase-like phosphatase (HAD superfamily)
VAVTPYRALLIDLDGTLADTAAANYVAYAQALGEHGVSVAREHFDAVAFGRNWKAFLPALLADAGSSAEPHLIAARKADIYPALTSGIRINHPLVRLIASSRPTCRTALVTTASAANAHAVLAQHGLADLFDTVITGSDVTRHKPDPEAYLLAAERLGVTAAECLVFEDSSIGVASAQAFGAMVIRVEIL